MPELELMLVIQEVREMRPKLEESLEIGREVKQTLHGPPGSSNGMYKDVQWLKTQMTNEVLPAIKAAKRGMSIREQFGFILLAALLSGGMSLLVFFLTKGG